MYIFSKQMDNTEEKKKIRVFVVDDHDQLRSKLISLLIHESDITVLGGACNGLEALAKIPDLKPDVVLMDVKMLLMDGIAATKELKCRYPDIKVLALSQADGDEYVTRMIQAGASGYVLKSFAVEELKTAIRTVFDGKQYFSPALQQDHSDAEAGGERGAPFFTRTELEVLRLVTLRHSSREIAGIMGFDIRTVEFHMANLLEKTGVQDTNGLVEFAIQHHMLDTVS